jgi:CheY-like chemotaxis protein
MPERLLVVAVRWLALFLLVVAALLIIVRWKFPVSQERAEGTLDYWRRVLRKLRERRANAKEKSLSLAAVRRRTALVVDPDEKSARVMAWKLENLGCKVVRSRNGAGALSQSRRSQVDFVISDTLLSDISAAEFYDELAVREAPVIFVGVLRDQWDELRAKGRNVACLAKPYDPEEVAALAGYMLRRRRQ